MSQISVVGMGYVGLPLGIAFDNEGYDVVGYDTDGQKTDHFTDGEDPTGEVGADAVRDSDITFTTDTAAMAGSEYYVITVPTPIDEAGRPDLSYVEAAAETVGASLDDGSTVVLESTVYPGATRSVLLPVLERTAGKEAGEDFFIGYSPERIVPGNTERGLRDIVKIVSGHDDTARTRLAALYGDIIDADLHLAPTLETAEAAKCLENTQRDINIALMNEFAFGCRHVDLPIEARDVIEAAATKWNFHAYHPGSVGGHCIPVDPNYLIWKFEQHGFDSRLMRTARTVNDDFATYVSEMVINALTERLGLLESRADAVYAGGRGNANATLGGDAPGAVQANGGQLVPEADERDPRLLVLGLAYKPNTNDIRSPVLVDLVDRLREVVDVVGIDPHAPSDRLRSTFDVSVQEDLSVADFDALLLATAHDCFTSLDLDRVHGEMNDVPVFVDVTGTYDREDAVEHGFLFRGI